MSKGTDTLRKVLEIIKKMSVDEYKILYDVANDENKLKAEINKLFEKVNKNN